MQSIQKIQGQPEVAGRWLEGLDVQHPEDSRDGRATGGWRKKGGGFECAASGGLRCGRHPEDSRGGRTTGGCKEKGGGCGCTASRGFKDNWRLQAEG